MPMPPLTNADRPDDAAAAASGALLDALRAGQTDVARQILRDAFWRNRPLQPDGRHLAAALTGGNRDAVQLMLTHGARLDDVQKTQVLTFYARLPAPEDTAFLSRIRPLLARHGVTFDGVAAATDPVAVIDSMVAELRRSTGTRDETAPLRQDIYARRIALVCDRVLAGDHKTTLDTIHAVIDDSDYPGAGFRYIDCLLHMDAHMPQRLREFSEKYSRFARAPLPDDTARPFYCPQISARDVPAALLEKHPYIVNDSVVSPDAAVTLGRRLWHALCRINATPLPDTPAPARDARDAQRQRLTGALETLAADNSIPHPILDKPCLKLSGRKPEAVYEDDDAVHLAQDLAATGLYRRHGWREVETLLFALMEIGEANRAPAIGMETAMKPLWQHYYRCKIADKGIRQFFGGFGARPDDLRQIMDEGLYTPDATAATQILLSLNTLHRKKPAAAADVLTALVRVTPAEDLRRATDDALYGGHALLRPPFIRLLLQTDAVDARHIDINRLKTVNRMLGVFPLNPLSHAPWDRQNVTDDVSLLCQIEFEKTAGDETRKKYRAAFAQNPGIYVALHTRKRFDEMMARAGKKMKTVSPAAPFNVVSYRRKQANFTYQIYKNIYKSTPQDSWPPSPAAARKRKLRRPPRL